MAAGTSARGKPCGGNRGDGMRKGISALVLCTSLAIFSCSDIDDNITLPAGRSAATMVVLNLGFADQVSMAEPSPLSLSLMFGLGWSQFGSCGAGTNQFRFW